MLVMRTIYFAAGYALGVGSGVAWGFFAQWQALQFRGMQGTGWALALLVLLMICVTVVCCVLYQKEQERKEDRKRRGESPRGDDGKCVDG